MKGATLTTVAGGQWPMASRLAVLNGQIKFRRDSAHTWRAIACKHVALSSPAARLQRWCRWHQATCCLQVTSDASPGILHCLVCHWPWTAASCDTAQPCCRNADRSWAFNAGCHGQGCQYCSRVLEVVQYRDWIVLWPNAQPAPTK